LASDLKLAIQQNRSKFRAYLQYCRGQENLNLSTLCQLLLAPLASWIFIFAVLFRLFLSVHYDRYKKPIRFC